MILVSADDAEAIPSLDTDLESWHKIWFIELIEFLRV